MTRIVAVGVIVGTLFAGSVLADELFSLKAGYQLLQPSGDFAAEVAGVGTRIDVESDLAMNDSQGVVAEAALNWGSFRLSGAYLPIRFDGNSTLTRTLTFNGTNFTLGSAVNSEAEIDFFDVGLTWFAVNLDDGPVRLQLGPEIAVKVVDADLSLVAPAASLQESEDLTAPIPTVGGRLEVGLADWMSLAGRVGWIGYDGNQFLDADVQLELSPVPMVGMYVGYRHFLLEVDESDVILDLRFSGPYVGAMIRF